MRGERHKQAAHNYGKQVYVLGNADYSWMDALRDAKYAERTIHSHAAEWWRTVAVSGIVLDYQAKSQEEAKDKADFFRAEHRRIQLASENKGDLATATANLVWNGKTYGLYTDVLSSGEEQKALKAASEAEQAEIRRITDVRLSEMREEA